MKLLLCVLISATLLASPVFADDDDENYQQISLSDFQNDTLGNDALTYGLDWIFKDAVYQFHISDSPAQVDQIDGVWKKEEGEKITYKFDIGASNDDANVNATFYVICEVSTDEKNLIRYDYTLDYKTHDNDNQGETETITDYEEEEYYIAEETEVEVEVEGETEIDITGVMMDDDRGEEQEYYSGEETETEFNKEVEVEINYQEEEELINHNSGGFPENIDLDDDLNAKEALAFGIEMLFEKAAYTFGTSNSNNETVTMINNFSKTIDDSSTYYRFDVEATNNNDATIQAVFTVNLENQEMSLDSYDYKIRYSVSQDDETPDYDEAADDDKYNVLEDFGADVQLYDSLSWGIERLFKRASELYGISDSKPIVSEIYSVKVKEDDEKTYYKFNVSALNNNDAQMNATYTIRYNNETMEITLLSFKYHIIYQTEASDSQVIVENNVEPDLPVEVGKADYEYNDIDVADYNLKLIRKLVMQGVSYVIRNEPEKIPRQKYLIKKIDSAKKKDVAASDSDFYQFEVQVESKDRSDDVFMKFTSEVRGSELRVVSYWFSVLIK